MKFSILIQQGGKKTHCDLIINEKCRGGGERGLININKCSKSNNLHMFNNLE